MGRERGSEREEEQGEEGTKERRRGWRRQSRKWEIASVEDDLMGYIAGAEVGTKTVLF
jgi:hypothetical protein